MTRLRNCSRGWFAVVCAGWAMTLSGCGNSMTCALKGDNLKGHVTFADLIPVNANAAVMVEWSRDSFATVLGRAGKQNVQGILAVPYSFCVDTGVDIQLRAYQDANRNAGLDAGEANGRFDQTADGSAAFVSKQVPASNESESWHVVDDADIVIDTP